jgi:hypothetical protein
LVQDIVFETSNTYGTVGSSFTGSNNQSFSTRTSLGEGFCGSSYKSTTSHSSYASKNSISNQSTRTTSGSFVTIHRNNIAINDGESGAQSLRRVIGFPEEEDPGYVPPVGELDPNPASPVGDVLLPMLLMVGVYAVVRLWRNRKLLFKIK